LARHVARRRRLKTAWGKFLLVGLAVWLVGGLLGTGIGLVKALGAVGGESIDPSQKARIPAEGISEAMNCSATGLLATIAALIALGLFLRTQKEAGPKDSSTDPSSGPTD
jgi:hypothetical protein